MPCFFMKQKVKNLLKELAVESVTELYRMLLENYSDLELHAMSEDQIVEVIKKIYNKHKKKLKKEVKLIYV